MSPARKAGLRAKAEEWQTRRSGAAWVTTSGYDEILAAAVPELLAALDAAEARTTQVEQAGTRDVTTRYEQVVALRARVEALEAALREARKDVLAINTAGPDSTRGRVAIIAIERIDKALAAGVARPPESSET